MIKGIPLHILIAETIRDPRSAARQLLGMNIAREHAWMALIAVVSLGAILSALPVMGITEVTPDMTPLQVQMIAMMQRPVIFAFINFAGTVCLVFGFYWTGRALGGQGRLEDMLVLMVWLQVVLLAVQVGMFLLGLVVPFLAALVSLAILPMTLWISATFVDEVHGFESLLKAVGVMFAWLVGLSIGLMFLLTLMGVGAGGIPGNV